MNIRRINRRLKKRFGPAVTATLTDGCIVLSGHLPAWAETVEACSLRSTAHLGESDRGLFPGGRKIQYHPCGQ